MAADITGERLGILTAVRYDRTRRDWECRCDCGRTTFVRITAWTRKARVSCGCVRYQEASASRQSHHLKGTSEYRSWNAMKRRCLNPRATQWAYYGGRGITICERWRNDFAAFYADMGPKPSREHSLDRVDNDGNYEPGNCRWATRKEQVFSSRMANKLTFNGITDNIAGWTSRLGLPRGVLATRLCRGVPLERALTQPLRVTKRTRKAN